MDEPGVTRDRLYGRSFWGDNEFMVVDTGGVLSVSKTQNDVIEELAISTTIGMDGIPLASREAAVARMPSMIERQATAAVEEASVVIFLVDGQVVLIYDYTSVPPLYLFSKLYYSIRWSIRYFVKIQLEIVLDKGYLHIIFFVFFFLLSNKSGIVSSIAILDTYRVKI